MAGGGALPSKGDWLDRVNHNIEGTLGTTLLLGSAAISITAANSPGALQWLQFWSSPTSLRVGQEILSKRAVVNEGFMALFFFKVGLEIKREMVKGSLSNRRSALLPCIAAVGGMVVPMLIYLVINTLSPAGSLVGVTIPMATDIAFAMAVFSSFGSKLPAAVSTFLLTLATVDDLGAIFVIATCFAKNVRLSFLGAAAGVQLLLTGMERTKVSSGRAYLGAGAALWWCLIRAGVNADIAGVCVGLCVHASRSDSSIVDRLIRRWTAISGLAIMPLFALANCAIPLFGPAAAATSAPAVASASAAPVALGVFAGLVLGKPLGIVSFSLLGVKLGMGKFPEGMTPRHLQIVGLLGGLGFTMCIFLIEQALPQGRVSVLSKLAVILGSLTAAALSAFAMKREIRAMELSGICSAPESEEEEQGGR